MEKKGSLMKAGTLCMLSIAAGALFPMHALADEVTLKSADGTVNLTGELLAFEDNSYMVRTPLGELRIAASRVTCTGDACPVFEVEGADIEIAGADAVGLGLMPLLLEGFAGSVDAAATISNTSERNTLVAELVSDGGFGDDIGSFLVKSSGSTDGFSSLLAGQAQIGMSSRRIRPEEARALRDAGGGNMVSPQQEHIIAVDSLVVITHPSNPINSLTMEQLGEIYSGTIKNWKDVGGPDQKILVVDRPEGSGTRDVFAELFKAASVETVSPLEVRIANDNAEVAAIVNENENAIGFVGYAFQRGAKPLTMINECGQPMTPDAFSARTEEYALQRRMYLYTRADAATDQVSDFLQYVSSPAADPVIAKSGFIGLGIDRQIQTLESDRARKLLDPNVDQYEASFMRDMLSKMVDYDRLSTTFRFRTGSSSLDERGRVDMQRLADYLEKQPAGTEVLFVGFTDSVGAFDSNKVLSEGRAEQALAELQSYAGSRLSNLTLTSTGYGEIAPSGCNVAEDGRRINRRVEVWIKSAG